MNKFIITILGKDRPGIIAAVTQVLFELDCNIEDVRQNLLQGEFSGIFLISGPTAIHGDQLKNKILTSTESMGLNCHVKPIDTDPSEASALIQTEPFVISTRGPDCKGLVAQITAILAEHHVNVTQLQAVFRGGSEPEANVMVYEVDVPQNADMKVLRSHLKAKADELKLVINFQHKAIFEAINRV